MIQRSKFGNVDLFSVSPFLSIMPVLSSINELEHMTSSLFARYEKVSALRRKLKNSNNTSDEYFQLRAEEKMLKSVLDWLSFSLKGEDE